MDSEGTSSELTLSGELFLEYLMATANVKKKVVSTLQTCSFVTLPSLTKACQILLEK